MLNLLLINQNRLSYHQTINIFFWSSVYAGQGGKHRLPLKNKKLLVLKEDIIKLYVNTKQSSPQCGVENKCQMNDAENGQARKSQRAGVGVIGLLRGEKDF